MWETTYESIGAYATTYMTHPYHAALLDRFLLPDCPERITTSNNVGAGLIGYTVAHDRPLGGGDPPAAAARLRTRSGAADEAVRAVAAADDGWSDSILAENTMATRWFDGETDLGGRPAWSHLWDQCFGTVEQTRRTGAARARRRRSRPSSRCRSAEIVYVPRAQG